MDFGDEEYDIELSDNQSYNYQWTVGNTYEVTATLMGKKTTFDVTIAESPLTSFKMADITIIEGTHGYYTTSWDEESGEYKEYYRYNIIYPEYTLFYDGAEITGTGRRVDFGGEEYYISLSYSQSYDNP